MDACMGCGRCLLGGMPPALASFLMLLCFLCCVWPTTTDRILPFQSPSCYQLSRLYQLSQAIARELAICLEAVLMLAVQRMHRNCWGLLQSTGR